jgi:hypothetical protein
MPHEEGIQRRVVQEQGIVTPRPTKSREREDNMSCEQQAKKGWLKIRCRERREEKKKAETIIKQRLVMTQFISRFVM